MRSGSAYPLMLLLLLTACGDDVNADRAQGVDGNLTPATPLGELVGIGEKGLFRFRIHTEPTPPKLGEYFSVWTTVERVSDASRVAGGTLSLDATMPEHRHGMTTLPKTRLHEDVRFHTVGCRFHMHGRWVIELDFSHEGQRDRATIEFPFHPPAAR